MPKQPKRLTVKSTLLDLSLYDVFDGRTPADVMEYIQQIQQQYLGRELYFEIRSYHETMDLVLYEQRLQTEFEYQQYLKIWSQEQERKRKVKQDQKDREFADFQRLKKKFEP